MVALGDWSFGDWSFGEWSFEEWSFGEWSVYQKFLNFTLISKWGIIFVTTSNQKLERKKSFLDA
jgi:hypothetical protein